MNKSSGQGLKLSHCAKTRAAAEFDNPYRMSLVKGLKKRAKEKEVVRLQK